MEDPNTLLIYLGHYTKSCTVYPYESITIGGRSVVVMVMMVAYSYRLTQPSTLHIHKIRLISVNGS